MKNIITLLLLCMACLTVKAQSTRSDPTPISKDSALMFKTIHEVLGLPETDSVSGGNISVISRHSNEAEPWKPRKGMADPIIVQIISQSHYGDRLIFEGFFKIDGDQKTKLDTKWFVIK